MSRHTRPQKGRGSNVVHLHPKRDQVQHYRANMTAAEKRAYVRFLIRDIAAMLDARAVR